MYSKRAVFQSNLHEGFKPVSHVVQIASRYQSSITIVTDNKCINVKSFRGLYASALKNGQMITIEAEGPDEEAAVAAILPLLA